MKNDASVHKLGCENEFSGVDMNYKNRSYKHRFLSVGDYEVQNEVFSFMICRITVIECTKAKSSNLNEIVSATIDTATTTDSALNGITIVVTSNIDTTPVVTADSTVNLSAIIHPVDIIHPTAIESIATPTPTIDTAVQDTVIQCEIASNTMKGKANHLSIVPSAVTTVSSKPCNPPSIPTPHLLHGSFATDTDLIKRNSGKIDDNSDVNINSNKSANIMKEIPPETNYMSTADIGTSIIAAMWKTSKSLASPSKSTAQMTSTTAISTREIPTSLTTTSKSQIAGTQIPHATKTSTSIDVDTLEMTAPILKDRSKNKKGSTMKAITTSTQSKTSLIKPTMTSTMTSTMTFTTITTATSTNTTTMNPPPSCPLTFTLPPASSSSSSVFLPYSNDHNKTHDSQSEQLESADIGTSIVAAVPPSSNESLITRSESVPVSGNISYDGVTDDSANMDIITVTEVPLLASPEVSNLEVSSSIPSTTMKELLATCTLPTIQTTVTSTMTSESIEASNFQSNPLLPPGRMAQLTASSQSLLEQISTSQSVPSELKTSMSSILSAAIKATPTIGSQAPTVATVPTVATGPVSTTVSSNSTAYAGLRGSFGVTTSTQSPAKEITDAIRNNAKTKKEESLNKIQNIFKNIQNEIANCKNINKTNESSNRLNNDCLVMKNDPDYGNISINNDVENLETVKSGHQKRNAKKNLKKKAKKVNINEKDESVACIDDCIMADVSNTSNGNDTGISSSIITTSTSTSGFITPSSIIVTTTSASTSATITNDTNIASKYSVDTAANVAIDSNGGTISRVYDDDNIDYITTSNKDIIASTADITGPSSTPEKPSMVSIYSPYTNTTTEVETQAVTPSSYERVDSLISPSLHKERVLFSVDWEDIDSSGDEEYENDGFDDDDSYDVDKTEGHKYAIEKEKILLTYLDDEKVLPKALMQQPLNSQYLEQKSNNQSVNIPSIISNNVTKKGANNGLQDQQKKSQKKLKEQQKKQHLQKDQKLNDEQGERVVICSASKGVNSEISHEIPIKTDSKMNQITPLINDSKISNDINSSKCSDIDNDINQEVPLDINQGGPLDNNTTPVKSLANKLKDQLGIGQNKMRQVISPFSLTVPSSTPVNGTVNDSFSPNKIDFNVASADGLDTEKDDSNDDKYQNDIEDFLEKRKFSHLMKHLF
jgi:hypothetical protein